MQGRDYYVHGVSLDTLGFRIIDLSENMFIDEEIFEDNGQITAIELRAGSEIYAIRAR